MRIPFDIKYKSQIESGEYKVILDCNVEAEILAWDKPGEYPIVCMAKKEGAIPFRTNNNGKAYHFPEGANYSDLFIVTPEKELTPFENGLRQICEDAIKTAAVSPYRTSEDFAKRHSAELLSLAREQFIQDGYVIEKKAFHDAVEKVTPEVMKEVSENVDAINEALRLKYEKGRADVLKNLPRWKVSNAMRSTMPTVMYGDNGMILYKDGFEISISGLEKLPGFKED